MRIDGWGSPKSFEITPRDAPEQRNGCVTFASITTFDARVITSVDTGATGRLPC